ncbi:hypothetical protein ACX6XY_10650 [Streptomyces sp. O3]
MVGLFWITGDAVYLGAPPDLLGRAVLVTDAGLDSVGHEQVGGWPWAEVRGVAVRDVPLRSAVRRRLSLAGTLLLSAVFGGIDEPPAMTVCVDTADGGRELTVASAAAAGYGRAEITLSHTLLDRFADGSACPSRLADWARTHPAGTPGRARREALLRQWAAR